MKFILIALVSILIYSNSYSSDVVINKNGENILLNDDGTWSIIKNKKDVISSPIQVVRSYLDAKRYNERLNFVLDKDKVKKYFEDYYASEFSKIEGYKILNDDIDFSNIKNNEFVTISVMIQGEKSQVDYLVKKVNDKFLVDWESSVGFNAVSCEEFKTKKDINPINVRVYTQLNSNSFDVEGKKFTVVLYDWTLTRSYGSSEIVIESEIGSKIFNAIKNGKTKQMILKIHYDKYNKKYYRSNVVIDEIISIDSWYL